MVTSVHPARRTLRIEVAKSYIAFATTLTSLECINKNGRSIHCKTISIDATDNGVIATLVPGVPRDTIVQLKKTRIVVDEAQIVRDTKHFDTSELDGLTVIRPDGAAIGRIVGTFDTQANGMIEVQTANGSIVLPVVDDVVSAVNWDTGNLTVHEDFPADETFGDNHDSIQA